MWSTGSWGICTADCGDGRQTRVVECIEPISQRAVKLSLCLRPQPERQRACNTWACEPNPIQCQRACEAQKAWRGAAAFTNVDEGKAVLVEAGRVWHDYILWAVPWRSTRRVYRHLYKSMRWTCTTHRLKALIEAVTMSTGTCIPVR